jgi:hypothetical protein
MSKDHAAGLNAAAEAFKKFQNEAELPAVTRNAHGHIIGITAGGRTNEQIAQVVVEAYLNARGKKWRNRPVPLA